MTKPKAYAGIGARKTPPEILGYMAAAASQLSAIGLVLRSGGAEGADTAFEQGSDPSLREIFLPWKGFRNHPSELYRPLDEAYHLAARYHPNWSACTQSVRHMMARNSHQILGASLNDPVLFVLCWTPEGRGEGGTGQAIRMARDFKIPVFDMGGTSLEEIEAGIGKILT